MIQDDIVDKDVVNDDVEKNSNDDIIVPIIIQKKKINTKNKTITNC